MTQPQQTHSSPSPATIRTAREKLQLTQTQAAAIVHRTLRAWQGWEAPIGSTGHRHMPQDTWELFLIKTKKGE